MRPGSPMKRVATTHAHAELGHRHVEHGIPVATQHRCGDDERMAVTDHTIQRTRRGGAVDSRAQRPITYCIKTASNAATEQVGHTPTSHQQHRLGDDPVLIFEVPNCETEDDRHLTHHGTRLTSRRSIS
jgi:hypothetical protein